MGIFRVHLKGTFEFGCSLFYNSLDDMGITEQLPLVNLTFPQTTI